MRFTLWYAMDMLYRWAHGSYSGVWCNIVRFAVVADRAINVAIVIKHVVVHHWVYSGCAINVSRGMHRCRCWSIS